MKPQRSTRNYNRRSVQNPFELGFDPNRPAERDLSPDGPLTLTFEKHFCFSPGTTFDLSRPTCLVGRNGSGKTSVISALLKYAGDVLNDREVPQIYRYGDGGFTKCSVTGLGSKRLLVFSAADTNNRFMNPEYDNSPGAYIRKVLTHGYSMGQNVQTQLSYLFSVARLHDPSKVIIVLDEPEMSLDTYGNMAVAAHLKHLIECGYHIICATHSERIMGAFGTVLEVDTRGISPSREYLEKNLRAAEHEWSQANL